MQEKQPNNPIHGVKLADMLNYLFETYGWEELGNRINIRCFKFEPSIKSSLVFLRRTPWAKEQVQQLYIYTLARNPKGKAYEPRR